jgi:type IV pilus assembly protein PilY1
MKSMSKFLAALLGVLAVTSAHADDSEVFTNSQFLSTGVRPNVLFVIDTSGSMDTEVKVYYEDGTVYAGDCPAGRIYWRMEDSNAPPDCATSNQWISVDNNRCRAAPLCLADDGSWRLWNFLRLVRLGSLRTDDPCRRQPPGRSDRAEPVVPRHG